MASVVQSGFGPILIACKNQLIAQVASLTLAPTAVLLVAKDEIPALSADYDVLLRPGSFLSVREYFDSAGRTATLFNRYLTMYPRRKVSLDETDRDDVFLTDPNLGYFAWEESCAACLNGFFPVDLSMNHLTTEEIRPARGADPKRSRLDDMWGEAAVSFEVQYLFSLNAVRWMPPLITTSSLPAATHGVAYSTLLAAASPEPNTVPWTWTATGLPAGLVMSATGTISGTVAAAGSYPFGVIVTDVNNQRGVSFFTLTVN